MAELRRGVGHQRTPARRSIWSRIRRRRSGSDRDGPPADLLTWTLIAAILTYVWRVQDLYPILGSIKLPILASAGALGLYILDTDRRRRIQSLRHPIIILSCVIMGLAVLSIPGSIHDGNSFRFIRDDYSKNFLIMIVLAASVRSFADVKRYAVAMVVGGFLYAFYVHQNVAVGISGRLGDLIYYDANDLGMMLVCAIPFALYFLVRSPSRLARIGSLAAIGLFLLVIVKTGSRGAFLGLVAISGYLLFRFQSVKTSFRVTAVAAGLVALLVVGGEQYWSLMGTLLNPQDDYNWSGESETGRLETWKRGMGYMAERPFLGVGVDAFPVAEGTIGERAYLQDYGIGVKWAAAHNSFVQIGAELGVFGLIAFMALLFQGYRTARAGKRAPPGRRASDEQAMGEAMAGSLVGYVVTGFFLSQAYASFTLILLAMIVGLDKVRRQQPGRVPVKRMLRRRPAAPRPVAGSVG